VAGEQQRYAHGWWASAYVLDPVERPPSLPQFRDLLYAIKGSETGWPVWLWLPNRAEMLPYLIDDDVIECWLSAIGDDSHADFWRADRRGRMFMLRGYQEDSDATCSRQGINAGECLELTIPVWRTGECLLHAERLANRLGANTVELSMTWTGLKGRELSAFASMRHLRPGRVSAVDRVRTTVQVNAATISDVLPELVKQLVAPLYSRFDFFEPPDEFYAEELDRLLDRSKR